VDEWTELRALASGSASAVESELADAVTDYENAHPVERTTMTIARKIRLDLATPTEVVIRAAMAAVEDMGADVRLTEAGQHLQRALDSVASYVDEQMRAVTLSDDTALSWSGWRNVAQDLAGRLRADGKDVPYEWTRNPAPEARPCRHCGKMGSEHAPNRMCANGHSTFWPVGEPGGG
jgi:hypothetical protein